jgi:hypothetical protein
MWTIALTPLTTTHIKTTSDAITFLQLLRTGCRLSGIEWWFKIVMNEFPFASARAAATTLLAKATCIDALMQQNLDAALAPPGGVRVNMNAGVETPAPVEEAPAADTVPMRSSGSQTDSARRQHDLQKNILWHSRMPFWTWE